MANLNFIALAVSQERDVGLDPELDTLRFHPLLLHLFCNNCVHKHSKLNKQSNRICGRK